MTEIEELRERVLRLEREVKGLKQSLDAAEEQFQEIGQELIFIMSCFGTNEGKSDD